MRLSARQSHHSPTMLGGTGSPEDVPLPPLPLDDSESGSDVDLDDAAMPVGVHRTNGTHEHNSSSKSGDFHSRLPRNEGSAMSLENTTTTMTIKAASTTATTVSKDTPSRRRDSATRNGSTSTSTHVGGRRESRDGGRFGPPPRRRSSYAEWRQENSLQDEEDKKLRDAAAELARQQQESLSGPGRRKISLVVSQTNDDGCVGEVERGKATQGSTSVRRPPPPITPNSSGDVSSGYEDIALRGSVTPRISGVSDDVMAADDDQEQHDDRSDTRSGGDDESHDGDEDDARDDPATYDMEGSHYDSDGGDSGGDDNTSSSDLVSTADAREQHNSLSAPAHGRRSLADFAAAARAAIGDNISPPPSANGPSKDRLGALCNSTTHHTPAPVQSQGQQQRRSDMRRRVWNGSSPTDVATSSKTGASTAAISRGNSDPVLEYWSAAARLEDLNVLDLADMVRSLRRDLRRSEERADRAKKEAEELRAQLCNEKANAEDLADALEAQKAWNDKVILQVLDRCPEILSSVPR